MWIGFKKRDDWHIPTDSSAHPPPNFQLLDLFFWGNLYYLICCVGYVIGPAVSDALDLSEHTMGVYGLFLAALYCVSSTTFWRAYESTLNAGIASRF